jgi:hypothetical protein
LHASEQEEQAIAAEAAARDIRALDLDAQPENTPTHDLPGKAETQLESDLIEEAAFQAQRAEAQALSSGERDLPPTGDEPGTGPPNERAQRNVRKALDSFEKGLENEAEVDAEKAKADAERVELGEEKGKEAGGFWGIFKRK